MEGQGEGGRTTGRRSQLHFLTGGLIPIGKCDICRNRIVSAGESGKGWRTLNARLRATRRS